MDYDQQESGDFVDRPELLADGAVDDKVDGGVEGEEEMVDLDQDEEHHRDVVATLLSAPDSKEQIQWAMYKWRLLNFGDFWPVPVEELLCVAVWLGHLEDAQRQQERVARHEEDHNEHLFGEKAVSDVITLSMMFALKEDRGTQGQITKWCWRSRKERDTYCIHMYSHNEGKFRCQTWT